MKFDNLANSSNEARHQRIEIMRNDFNHVNVVTVQQAVQKYGYTANTIIKWAKDGEIPLIIDNHQPTVVPLTRQNQPTSLGPIDNPLMMLEAYVARHQK